MMQLDLSWSDRPLAHLKPFSLASEPPKIQAPGADWQFAKVSLVKMMFTAPWRHNLGWPAIRATVQITPPRSTGTPSRSDGCGMQCGAFQPYVPKPVVRLQNGPASAPQDSLRAKASSNPQMSQTIIISVAQLQTAGFVRPGAYSPAHLC